MRSREVRPHLHLHGVVSEDDRLQARLLGGRLATLFDDFCVGPCSVFWGKLRGGTPPSDLADPLLEEPVAAEPEYEI